MPARHRYKCLNPNCPSITDARKPMTFAAMNVQPSCPYCRCIKLEDWGEDLNIMGGAGENTKNSDVNFRRIADRYGLTDMNNKDGQAVKRAAPVASGGPTVSIGGVQVPLQAAASGACANLPGMAQKIPAAQPGADPKRSTRNSGVMKQMTRVVAEHKGAA